MSNIPLSSSVEDFDDFFESSLCGFVITDADGKIIRANKCASKWLNTIPSKLVRERFSKLLSVGGRIYFETHLWPLLRMQGYFDEVALELTDSGNDRMPIFLNAYEKRDDNEQPLFIRFTLFRASDRRLYEGNLQIAKNIAESKLKMEQENTLIREQFIAVLGHDLRNPLGGIMSASQLLARKEFEERDAKLINIIQTGSKRMYEMINDIMDLARGRLGGGFPINPVECDLEKLLNQISEELVVAWPERNIITEFNINQLIQCDPGRFSQLISNLLANALTHGSPTTPILLKAKVIEAYWEVSVTNQGNPIPEEAFKHLFHPFRRESTQSSHNGLGLGLYIASEIAKAHNGTLSATSNQYETCFTFRSETR